MRVYASARPKAVDCALQYTTQTRARGLKDQRRKECYSGGKRLSPHGRNRMELAESSKESSEWKKGAYLSLGVFMLALLYAVIRYHVLRDIPLSHLPLFTMNKAIALS